MKNILRYVFYTMCLCSLIILSKPIYFNIKKYIIQVKLEYDWSRIKNNKQVNRYNSSIYPVGKITINSANIESIISSVFLEKTLPVSIAHIPNTSKPGESGNICLAAHRDTFFKNLIFVNINDLIMIEHLAGIDEYLVQDIKVIDLSETNYIHEYNYDKLTLLTCYPFDYFGNAPYRYLIVAKKM